MASLWKVEFLQSSKLAARATGWVSAASAADASGFSRTVGARLIAKSEASWAGPAGAVLINWEPDSAKA